jgi:hypothetical protein
VFICRARKVPTDLAGFCCFEEFTVLLSLRSRRFIGLSLAAALLLAVATSASAQTTTRIIGTVKDHQGGVLPGVTVTATSSSLIGAQSTVSEGNGTYQFPALPAGTYRVVFDLAGFQTVARDQVVLAVCQTLTIDTELPVGGLAETVQVTT